LEGDESRNRAVQRHACRGESVTVGRERYVARGGPHAERGRSEIVCTEAEHIVRASPEDPGGVDGVDQGQDRAPAEVEGPADRGKGYGHLAARTTRCSSRKTRCRR